MYEIHVCSFALADFFCFFSVVFHVDNVDFLRFNFLFFAIVMMTSLIILFLIVSILCMIIRGHKREGGW